MKKGKVYIVGAGPGDIGLLTVKGLRCLRRSEVVVYDFHLNSQVLNYINRNAEFVYAGKRGGAHAMSQDEINQAILKSALEGRIVCRLKGGDPFVFGRGGEEAEVLAAHGVEFEVVPGVSSSIAAPAYAGIPLTHRKHSSSFAVITGNEETTKPESAIAWDALAKGFDTLVFLMGVRNIGTIAARLIDHGKPLDTPVAVVRWGTRPDQKTVVGTLKDIAAQIREEDIRPPAVMVVGNVVRLRETLSWYEKKPLFGHRILITRAYTHEYEPLEDLGAEIFEFPTLMTAPAADYSQLDVAIREIESYNWAVFTSVNGWKFFIDRYLSSGRDIRDMKGLRFCAIGPKTAEAIRSFGIRIDLTPGEFNAEGLAEAFTAAHGRGDLSGVRILLPRAELAREIFPDRVRELGGHIDTPPAYRAVKPEKHGKRLKRFLQEGRISVSSFTSAATFRNFVDIIGEGAVDFLRGTAIAAIGPVTAAAVEKAGLKVSVTPREATIPAMVDAIAEWCRSGGSPSP